MLTKERTEDAIADLKELYKSLYALEVNGKYTDAIRIAIGVMENVHHIIINSDGFCDMYGDTE